jgi:DNA topoisomerase-6 subunit A
MFQRLVKHAYWRAANCILVSLGGVPALHPPVRGRQEAARGVFVDRDPYGYSNIYRTLRVGSGNAAHMNEYFCVPKAPGFWASRPRTSASTICPRIP